MTNIYDSANQLEREIREIKEFKELEKSYALLKSDEAAYALFKEFQAFQQELQEKQMTGAEFSDEDAQKAQELTMKVREQEVINQLMEQERIFSTIINDLNKIIMTPISQLYQS